MVHRRKITPPKDVANERIRTLFYLAKLKNPVEPDLPSKYMRLAERIGKRMDLSIPTEIKRFYCKKCGVPYGDNTRIRIKKGLCIVNCADCGNIRRLPYKS